jgi:hypothetical protein
VADACGVTTPAGSGPDGHEVIPIGTQMVAGFRTARASRSEHAAVVVARTGARGAVLRRGEPTRFSPGSDDKAGAFRGAIRN